MRIIIRDIDKFDDIKAMKVARMLQSYISSYEKGKKNGIRYAVYYTFGDEVYGVYKTKTAYVVFQYKGE